MITPTLNTSPTVPTTTPPPVTPQANNAISSQGTPYLKPTSPIPVPTYGSDVTDASGKVVGQAKYDPNTDLPLTDPNANNGTTSTTGTNNSSTGTTGTNTSTSTQTNPALDQANADLKAKTDEIATAGQQVSQQILNIQNGATPLSPAESAQITGLQQQFQQLIDQQVLTNTGASGIANVRGYQTGAAEYDPSFQVKTIGSIVSAGQGKIADLQIKEASAVATLTQALKDNDIKAIKDAYDVADAARKDSQAALKDVVTNVQNQIKDAQAEADKQQTYALDVAKFNNDIKNTAFTQNLDTQKFAETIKSDAFDRAYKMEDLQLKKQANNIAGQNNNLPVVPTTAGGKPNAQSQVAFLAALPGGPTGAIATGIKGLTDYTVLPTTFSTRSVGGQPSQRQQFITLAKQYDPTYDENQAPARAQNLKDLASLKPGTIGYQKAAASTAIEHLVSYVDTMSKLPNTPISGANWLDNKLTLNPTVQKNIAQAKSDAEGFGTEFAKYLTGNAPDVNSINEQKAGLSPNNSPYTTQGNVQSKIDLLTGKFQTLAEQQASVMGKPVEATTLLGQNAVNQLSNLKNKGYSVSIPGVLYTDKDAWQKYGGGTQENWNSAVDTLTQLGLPLTPDNILQVAQQQ